MKYQRIILTVFYISSLIGMENIDPTKLYQSLIAKKEENSRMLKHIHRQKKQPTFENECYAEYHLQNPNRTLDQYRAERNEVETFLTNELQETQQTITDYIKKTDELELKQSQKGYKQEKLD